MPSRLLSRKKTSKAKRPSKKKKSRKVLAVKTIRKLSPKKKGMATKTNSPKSSTSCPIALASLHKNMTMKGKNGKVYTSVRGKKSKVWKWVRVSKNYHSSFRL